MKTYASLFLSFLQIGFFSIGGGYATIPLIQKEVVYRCGWLNMQEFTDIITISQMTPGPLAVNTSTFTGIRIAGVWGAVVATVGCILSGYVISLLMYRFFLKYQSSHCIAGVLSGLRAASAGLIFSAAATILVLALTGGQTGMDAAAAGIFTVSLLCLRRFKVNPLLIMAAAGAAGIFLYR